MVKTGIEIFCLERPAWARHRRIGLLCNQASVNSHLVHSKFLVDEAFPCQLKAIFSPQHGLFGEKQDNMKESGHEMDPHLGIPVFSLYERKRAPTSEQLEHIDLFIIDLQDVGTRVYTYVWTMLLTMKACQEHGITVAVLDRPNPIGGNQIEGNILEGELHSFVGMAPVPMRHGLTIGELALMFRSLYCQGLELQVLPMTGWDRDMLFPQTGLPWVLPSPNMPVFETALVYPGQVILEGTNLSEGRGTTRPFEIFGAPYLDTEKILNSLSSFKGCILREQFFEPTFNKWQHQRCRGFQVHVTDPVAFRPFRFTLALLSAVCQLYPGHFSWTPPPYEYEYEKLPADLIIGSRNIRKAVENDNDPMETEKILEKHERIFRDRRRQWLIYPEAS